MLAPKKTSGFICILGVILTSCGRETTEDSVQTTRAIVNQAIVTTGTVTVLPTTPYNTSDNGEVVVKFSMGTHTVVMAFRNTSEYQQGVSKKFNVDFGSLMYLAQPTLASNVTKVRGSDLIRAISTDTYKPICGDDMGKTMVSISGLTVGVGIRRGDSTFQAPAQDSPVTSTQFTIPANCGGEGYQTCDIDSPSKSCPWFNCSGGCGKIRLFRNNSCDTWKVSYTGWCNRGIAELIPYCRCSIPQTN